MTSINSPDPIDRSRDKRGPTRSNLDVLTRTVSRVVSQEINKISTMFLGILKAFDPDTGRCVVMPKHRVIYMPHQFSTNQQDIGLVEGEYHVPVGWHRMGNGGWRIIPKPGDNVVCLVSMVPLEKMLTEDGDSWISRIVGVNEATGLPKASDQSTHLPTIKGRYKMHDCIVMPFGVRTDADPPWFGKELGDNPISFGAIDDEGSQFLGHITVSKEGAFEILSPFGVTHRIQSEGVVALSAPLVTCNGKVLCKRAGSAISLPEFSITEFVEDVGGTITSVVETALGADSLADFAEKMGLPSSLEEVLDHFGLPSSIEEVEDLAMKEVRDTLGMTNREVMENLGVDKYADLAGQLGVPVDEVMDQTVGDTLNAVGVDTEDFLDKAGVSVEKLVGESNIVEGITKVGKTVSGFLEGIFGGGG